MQQRHLAAAFAAPPAPEDAPVAQDLSNLPDPFVAARQKVVTTEELYVGQPWNRCKNAIKKAGLLRPVVCISCEEVRPLGF